MPDLILGFDTSAAHCAAALLSGDRLLARRAEAMTRGQAERLMPMLEEMLAGCGAGWQDLAALGVGIGPGNFTGIRIAVSAARGLALGLGIPAVGVDGFEARASRAPAPALLAMPGPSGQVHLRDPEVPSDAARMMPQQDAQALARQRGVPLAAEPDPQDLAEAIARIAAARWRSVTEPPAPLYARAADAAPSRETPPVLLD